MIFQTSAHKRCADACEFPARYGFPPKPWRHLILNVPSVESLLYSYFRETEWYRKGGSLPHKAEKQVDASYIIQPKRIGQGICIFISHLTLSSLWESPVRCLMVFPRSLDKI